MVLEQKSSPAGLTWLAVRAIAAIVAVFVARFLYRGYQQRMMVKKLVSQGIPVLPHSWLLGHIKILNEFRTSHPADVSFYQFPAWLKSSAGKYFPQGKVPGVVYVDLWPLTYSYAFVLDGEAGTQFTVSPSLNKHDVVGDYLVLMTHGHDLFAGNGQLWKKWRSRLNPGFSSRHMATMIPEILEEVITDIRIDDQKAEEGHPIKVAMVDQIKLMNDAFVSLMPNIPFSSTAKRLKQIDHFNDVVRDILLPHIEAKIKENGSDKKRQTSLDLALKSMDKDLAKEGAGANQAQYIDQLISNLKIMMFAGHDTTAITICMMFKCLQDNPKCLEQLRAEHDAVLGPDPQKAAEALTESPHLIHSLPYTLAVIKETLRLYPIASTVRKGTPDCFLTPKGETTRYPTDGWAAWSGITVIHRDPVYWPRPDEFLPERWTVEAGHPLHPILNHAWQAFAIGPRNCIGMELALTELKLVSVLTARVLEIREAWDEWDQKQGASATPKDMINGERLYMVGAGTMHPKDEMPVCVRLRA
ncbi:hypothetical protein DL767_003373 [Monosporascus sp. MG133]|nr:hypothetical protein DL767_003373 [Monosporascus sp. MG133]